MISTRGSSVWLLITGIFELLLAGFFLFLGLLIPEVTFGFGLTAFFLGVVGIGLIAWGARWRGREQEAARIRATGYEGRATITGLTQTGMWINNNPVVSFDLFVEVPGRAAYPVTLRETVPQILLGRLTSGVPLPVKVDPADPMKVVVDWSLAPPVVPPVVMAPMMGVPYPAPTYGQPGMPMPYPAPPPQHAPHVPAPPIEAVTPAPEPTQEAERERDDELGGRFQSGDEIAAQAARQLAASRLRAIGRRAVATVVDVADTGASENGERVVRLTLNVRPQHGEPYRVTHETPVPAAELAGLTEGTPLPVRVDPTDQTQLVMDWHRVD